MKTDRPTWFTRNFDHGTRRSMAAAGEGTEALLSPPSPAAANSHEEARLAGYAEAMTASAALARTWEAKGANAGVLRIQLEQRADEAWNRLDARHHRPLEAAPNIADGAASSGREEPPPSLPPDLVALARTLDQIRATLIRLVDAGDAPPLEFTVRIVELLERVSVMLRGGVLTRQGSPPEPQSPRAVDPPTLRVV